MFSLSNLPKSITTKTKKRIGRGYGSGKGGHTSSRGAKGQNSRSGGKTGLFFEGTKKNKDFFRRTPWLRGKNRLKSNKKDIKLIKSSQLSSIKEGSVIDEKSLIKAKIITQKKVQKYLLKIVFDKDPGKKFQINLPASKKVIDTISIPKTKEE